MKIQDITGRVFGRLTVLSFEKTQAGRGSFWNCQCSCGKTKSIAASALKTGNTKSCGCLQKEKVGLVNFKDLTGKVFGRLTVLSKVSGGTLYEGGRCSWLCKCTCGKQQIIGSSTLLAGTTVSCGCYMREAAVISGRRRGKYQDDLPGLGSHYRIYKGAATSRNLSFNLSLEEFKQTVLQPCHYCGAPPKERKVGRYTTAYFNGLDRQNNALGYIKENIVACCTYCNKMKLTYSEEQFISHCKTVANHKSKQPYTPSNFTNYLTTLIPL